MLLKRLRYYCDLDEETAKPLLDMPGRIMEAPRGTDLIVSGDAPTYGFVVETGWAIRYCLLSDGRRQVLNVLLPGDIFDLQVFIAAEADHSVTAITDMTVKTFKAEDLLNIFNLSGRLAQALWWAAVQEEAMLREQIVRNGRRNAGERTAHFLLELHRRALIVDEGAGDGFRLPMTQSLIGDALGLTSIHVNRTLKRFRDEGMIRRSGQWIELTDIEALVELCDFDPSYLHLDAYPRRLKFRNGNGNGK
ncbi:Crp/Fnr family transcriptional regulator [Emcibacter sp. SYSU 3D8]